MPTRRIVTGEVDGRSRVISDGAVEAATNWEELWTLDVTAPLSTTAGETCNVLVPARGIARWRLFAIPNEEEMRRRYATDPSASPGGVDERGFHKTATVDLIYVLDGEIALVLDDGHEMALRPGDVVIQRAAYHAWKNRSEEPVHLLGLMLASEA